MQNYRFLMLIALLLSISCSGTQEVKEPLPAAHVESVDSTPDLAPSDPTLCSPTGSPVPAPGTGTKDGEAPPPATLVEKEDSTADLTPTDPAMGSPTGGPMPPAGAGTKDGEAPPPAAYVEKVNSTPDLTQTDPTLGLLKGGVMSCGSVSATNGFAWLADHGFEQMVHRYEDGSPSYPATAQAMDRLLRLKETRGALPPAFSMGVERYLAKQGYKEGDYRLELQGWARASNAEGTGVPDLLAIKKGLVGSSAVWLFVGFYDYDEQRDEYRIISHHYVTLVGYGLDELGIEDPSLLIVHDPAPRSGPGVSHDHVRVERIEHGTITVDPESPYASGYWQLPVDATDYYRLGTGLAYNPNADVAILDGVVILEMK